MEFGCQPDLYQKKKMSLAVRRRRRKKRQRDQRPKDANNQYTGSQGDADEQKCVVIDISNKSKK